MRIASLLVALTFASAVQAQDPVSCVQSYLADAGYPVGAIDGVLGRKTSTHAAEFSSVYPELALPELSADTAPAWCSTLGEEPAQAIKALRTLPPFDAPAETVAKAGGLRFSHPLVKENFGGQTRLWHDYERSIWPGRVTIETDPARVRSGDASIRMHLLPGDCGWTTHRDNGGWNDCDHGNARVETNADAVKGGAMYYGLSLMLADNVLALEAAHGRGGDVNLFQWYQYDAGACFNIQYNAASKQLNIDVRCERGNFKHVHRAVFLNDTRPNVWHEFVVHVNWTKDPDGYFRVLQNGKLVMAYSGPTLASEGRPMIVDHPQVYEYGGGLRATAAQQYRTPLTVWFDDMVRNRSLADIKARFEVPDGAFDDLSVALPIRSY